MNQPHGDCAWPDYKRVKDPNIVASMSGHKEGSKAFARYRVIDKVAEANAKEIDKDIKRDALKVFEAIWFIRIYC